MDSQPPVSPATPPPSADDIVRRLNPVCPGAPRKCLHEDSDDSCPPIPEDLEMARFPFTSLEQNSMHSHMIDFDSYWKNKCQGVQPKQRDIPLNVRRIARQMVWYHISTLISLLKVYGRQISNQDRCRIWDHISPWFDESDDDTRSDEE